jgi:hypothetical protein
MQQCRTIQTAALQVLLKVTVLCGAEQQHLQQFSAADSLQQL